jgi:hypothetical protein
MPINFSSFGSTAQFSVRQTKTDVYKKNERVTKTMMENMSTDFKMPFFEIAFFVNTLF